MSDDIPVIDLEDHEQFMGHPDSYAVVVDKDGNEKRVDELSAHPDNRLFREAWTLSGTVISEDLEVAKNIFKDKIREVRKPLLEAEDITYMRAQEDEDEQAKSDSIAKKNNLRNATASEAISSASTIDQLKAAWDSDLLGPSPYA